MKPEGRSLTLLGVTRSKAKMIEYGIPEQYQIKITQDPARLFTISISMLGDLAAAINRGVRNSDLLFQLRNNLTFSAQFFDSYFQSRLNGALDPYLLLLGSASYYLCDLPGSASVLVKHIDHDCPNLEGEGLEGLLLRLLQDDLEASFRVTEGPFRSFIDEIKYWLILFSGEGKGEEQLLDLVISLRKNVYEFGTPRQLLLGDILGAVVNKKINNSVWKALPTYSGLPLEKWLHVIQKESFIKELWPAQHLMGSAGVLMGTSAIIQMPTSAGKTKATELILRSAFLSERASLAIIVAPFRALCHEIKNQLGESFQNEPIKINELSDVIQKDFKLEEILGHQQILIVTPEKLLYILRHNAELATHIGLMVFDEGHQFDSGTRGITYELLLTSLRAMVPEDTQKVLISAVISNAEAIGEWLNGNTNVVSGTNLIPTYRSVGFTSWLDLLGRIEFVNSKDPGQTDFFVPRVIEMVNLGRKERERADRFFPVKSDGHTISLYLGLKLVPNGSVAIFCGRKSTASSICEKAVDLIERGSPFNMPSHFSNSQEVQGLTLLYEANLGADSVASRSAAQGVFSHHGNTPHGIRIAVEHAMREDLVRFVICTSTLAQGVNLPIRYLIVTSVYQGMDRIRVRDFHNLIGRAGRSGMHTEGSILFADPEIYDKRMSQKDKWRWTQVKELLDPSNAEPCISNLLSIFEPITSDNEEHYYTMEAVDFVRQYITNPNEVTNLAIKIATDNEDKGFSYEGVMRQFAWRISLISAVESFLLTHWQETEDHLYKSDVTRLATGTLAYFLAHGDLRKSLLELFHLLAENISASVPDSARRAVYGRTLYGVHDAQAIEGWVQSNADNLLAIVDESEILDIVWPLFTQHITVGLFTKFDKPESLKELARGWLGGQSFGDLLRTLYISNVKMTWGTRYREFKIDHIVEICEGTLAYDGTLLINALCEFVRTLDKDDTRYLITILERFQKRLKYGLPEESTITIYELGFTDRVISQALASLLRYPTGDKAEMVETIRDNFDEVNAVISQYPKYYQDILFRLNYSY